MTKRIFKSVFSVSVIIALCCSVLVVAVLYNYFQGRYRQTLRNDVDIISAAVQTNSDGFIYDFSQLNTDIRVTLISADGTVLYDSVRNATEMENHSDREEFAEAVKNGYGESTRYSATLSEKTFYCAKLMPDGTVLRVCGSQASAFTITWGMLQTYILILSLALALSAFLSYRVTKATVKPINEIDLDAPENTKGLDELSPLLLRISEQNKEIKKQLSELRHKQQEFSMITENMSEGFIVIDSMTNVLSYNQSVKRIFGIEDIETGESVFVINRNESLRKAVETALSAHHSEEILTVGEKIYSIFANPVFSRSNQVKGAVILILDITEKEKREVMRKEFSANVSHELKTPLTSISGFAEIIRDGIVKTEDIPHFADNIYKETSRLISLVNDIIEISQLDENSFNTEKENFDITKIAREVAESLSVKAKKKDVTISVNGDECVVSGYPRIVEEMIFNLCDNAIIYNTEGGKVEVTVSGNSENVTLSVKDTGIGIAPEHCDRIFERFYRVDKSRSKETGGTGLGLSIVKHGAMLHNAKINVESEIGKGTMISVTF